MTLSPPPGAELPGPFHTRRDAARLAGVRPAELAAMAGAVRLDGPLSLEEVYPAFQFAPGGGFVAGLPDVVASLGGALGGRALVGWLLAARPELGGASVVGWLAAGRPPTDVLALVAGERRAA